jgi:hypothetical protein
VGSEAIVLVAATINAVPDTLTRSDILAVLRRELRPEEVESFCASLQEVWKAIDLLDAPVDLESVAFAGVDLFKDRFGDETARKLIFAPCTTGPLGDDELEQKQKEAAKYASEPGRFTLLFAEMEMKADHGNALIMYSDGDWSCSCDFFNTQRTCEHVMAGGRLLKPVPIVQPRGNLEDT